MNTLDSPWSATEVLSRLGGIPLHLENPPNEIGVLFIDDEAAIQAQFRLATDVLALAG